MIVKFVGVISGVNGVIDYAENDRHVSDLVGMSPALSMHQEQPSGPVPTASTTVSADALDNLLAYVDESRKTLVRRRQITDDMADAIRSRSDVRPDIADAWMHIVVAYHPSDRPRVTDEAMAEDAADLVQAMAANENAWRERRGRASRIDGDSLLWLAVTHREKDHLHQHVILCRIDADGGLLSNSGHRNVAAARSLCSRVEQERGYVRTKDWDVDRPDQWYRRDDHMAENDAVVAEIQAIADESANADDLTKRLAERGLTLTPTAKGYRLSDAEGTSERASRFGLGGRRRPDRIGQPLSPGAAAREDLWTVVGESEDWSSLEEGLAKRGLRMRTGKKGVVDRIERVGPDGKPLRGQRWSPADIGFRRPPRCDDASWFQQRKLWEQRSPRIGGPARRASKDGKEQKAGQAVTDKATGVILLPRKGQSWQDAINDLASQREQIAARIATKDRAAIEARAASQEQVKPKEVSHPAAHVVDQAAAAPTTAREPTAADRAAFDRDMQFVQRSLASLRRESDLATQRRLLGSRGIVLSYDERTSAWYASKDGCVAAVPGLAGVADDGRGSRLAEVKGPTVPVTTPEKKADPTSVPGAGVVKKALPKPRLPDRDDRRRLPDLGP